MVSSKSAVRDRLRARRDGIPPTERQRQAREIARQLTLAALWPEAGSVLLYRSIGSEVATDALFDAAWRDGKRVGAPRVVGGRIRSVVVDAQTAFEPGAFDVPEPAGPSEAPETPWDVVVVPGIAFDDSGHRVGYGMGYYDAFLASKVAGATVGLAYRQTFVTDLPVEDHDVPVEWVATPDTLHRAKL